MFQSFDVVQKFVDNVYSGLCSNEFLLDITFELANVFGMLTDASGKNTKTYTLGLLNIRAV